MTKVDRQTDVEIILDSISPAGVRLTTFKLTYPRFIHSEFLTHRIFSRNASSSRAIPVEKMIAAVEENPVIPEFGANQKGMQAGEKMEGFELEMAVKDWLWARDQALTAARNMTMAGIHKQVANRVPEPFSKITVVATATDLHKTTFFPLRAHPLAQPEFQVLAYGMQAAFASSEPIQLMAGEWAVPFVRPQEWEKFTTHQCLMMSVARCARTSYLNFDGRNSPAEDLQLAQRLQNPGKDSPGHWSPFEHQGRALDEGFHRSGNFKGYDQLRVVLEQGGSI